MEAAFVGGGNKPYPTRIELSYKPCLIKNISGIWLLIAGQDNYAEVYSSATLRCMHTMQTEGRVVSAVGSRQFCFVGTTSKQIHVYSLKTWLHLKTVPTIHAVTSMDIMSDRILVYGLGDEGYGCLFYREGYRQYEKQSGSEKNKKAVAKTCLITNFREDCFVWKSGGYTTATSDRHKTTCWLVSQQESPPNSGNFKEVASK